MDSPQFGPYRIEEEIGRGGMGVVYRARDDRLQRSVALKLLAPVTGTDPTAQDRFFAEARAASAIDHPNICTVFDVGETASGQRYIAMAFYDGRTLKERIAEGTIGPDEAVAIALQIADGLAAAHARGIVHRDVKPGNILLTDSGTVKLLDFGVAKMAGVDLTVTNATLGTAAYMSPEQAKGEPVDGRTDIWALGAILYEMLTGRRPFPGDYQQAVIYGILNEDPDLGSLDAFDAAISRIVATALSKVKEERFEDAGAFAAELRAIRAGQDGSAIEKIAPEAVERRRRTDAVKKVSLLVGALVAALVLGWITYPFFTSGPAPPGSTSSIAVLPF
ncbi:MAG TPA: serine/threonine-protein kinase, partial [Rhodothermales bacterium]|nr:serine/threonine-protein kinase [Rhodothermales bacterium]